MFLLMSEQARGRPTRSVRATWRPRPPCWWQCWTWSGFWIAIQPDSALKKRIRIGLDFEKTQKNQIWISKLHWLLQ